ncbi:dynein heavy chain 5, axonemal-like [Dendronephthya gigantea]|uniref:dynein heavy chain 5, axonemal-like n=1 Tax=Dendronephthya gigantea TaxID=151771 RepID=UPI00106B0B6E|nr:dynein heavy chain 5, axonemal-like [Dendronephthya gigantea]
MASQGEKTAGKDEGDVKSTPSNLEVAPPLVSSTKAEETGKHRKRRGQLMQKDSRPIQPSGPVQPRSKSVTLVTSETLKERQKIIKNLKERRKTGIDARHQFLFTKIADAIGIDATTCEDFILGDQKFDDIEEFFKADGSKAILFLYQESTINRPDLSGHAANSPKKLFIADRANEHVNGICLFFLRTNTKAISTSNVGQEVNFMMLDASDGRLLEGFEKLLGKIMVPALRNQKQWGQMSNQQSSIQEFLENLEKFVNILSGAKNNMDGRVKLGEHDLKELLDGLNTPTDYLTAAKSPETVDKLEGLVALWAKEIELVLAKSEQLRKEADDIGPAAELDHWKQRMAKFNSLLDEIKSRHCKAAIGVLHAAKSKSLKHWKDLDSRITDAANEAKDNVKYLYTLDKFFGPLVKCSPTEMIEYVPSLMNSIRMIHTISQYYNTSERMTSLFVKVTNQMISTCKAYINKDVSRIWDLPRETLSSRLQEAVKLNEVYQTAFHRTKNKLKETKSERQFEFSENYIFGKFDAFCKRLEKLDDMLIAMENLSGLQKIKIEGIETIVIRYQTMVATVKKKTYDLLDHRKGEFDTDYEEFKQSVEALKEQLQLFVDTWFEKSLSTTRALELLGKFENIKGVKLYLDDKYDKVLMQYRKDLDTCRKIYQKFKHDPPVQRNLPPVAGKITWSRQLFRRIHEPMKVFRRYPDVLKGDEAKRIVRNFNKMASVLVEFEVLYHRGWMQAVELARSGMQASLLVIHPETKKLFVNFDPQILELIRECRCMRRLGLEIPESARVLWMRENAIKSAYNRLVELLQEYSKVVGDIPEIVLPLMKPFINKVEDTIKPGLTMLSWTSMNIEGFIDNIQNSLGGLKRLSKEVTDILDCRIEAVLEDISSACLCELPEDDSITVEEFLKRTEDTCSAVIVALSRQSRLVESAVDLLLATLKGRLNAQDLVGLEDEVYRCLIPEAKQVKGSKGSRCWECMPCCYWNLVVFFNQKTIDAIVKCTRISLDFIKRYVQSSSKYMSDLSHEHAKLPLFKAEIILAIPAVQMRPSVDDIQHALNKAVQIMLKTTQRVYQWEKHDIIHQPPAPVVEEGKPIPPVVIKSLYRLVSEHKDVVKVVIVLNSIISSFKMDAKQVLSGMAQFEELWNQDPNTKVQEFMDSTPLLSDFETQIRYYQELEMAVEELPASYSVGSIIYSTEPLKRALVTETKAWKQAFGKALANKASADMEEIFTFFDNMCKRLSRPIKDLDDVRNTMAALREVRESEIKIDMTIGPIEESFALLNKYGLHYSSHDSERVDSLTYSWKKVNSQASSVQTHLLEIEPEYKTNLLNAVEVYKDTMVTFVGDYDEKGPMVVGTAPSEASDRLQIFQARFDELWRKYQTYSGGEELFGLPVTEYDELQRIRRELGLLQKLYSLYNSVIENVNGYQDILWSEIDVEKINGELLEYQNRIRKLPKALKEWQAFLDLKKTIDDFSESCPLLEMMAHKAMKARHWERISNVTKTPLDVESETFSLRSLMSAPLLENKEDIEDICIAAVKEKDIEAKLKGVVADWNTQIFSFGTFKNRGEFLLKGGETSEIVSLMEDSLMILGSLMSNRYNAPFKAEIQKWVAKLTGSTEIIENWLVVQNLWVYLEAVFVGGDIAKQLPQEAKRFSQIDKSWVKIMQRAHETPNVVQCCVGDDTLGQLLPHLLEQLEMCQKSLSGYLEKKRLLFPRFFFVSDPALLEILGQASDSHTIQAHLLSVFDNLKTVTFDEKDYDKILAINSSEGEQIQLEKPIMAQGNVEQWLLNLLNAAQGALHAVIKMASVAIKDPVFKLLEFMDTFPAQVGLLGIQMIWTRDSEDALSNAKSDKKIMAQRNTYFLDMLNELIDVTTRELTKMERTRYETLVTIHVHQRDIFDELVKKNIKSPTDFEWLKQSRFYFKEDTDQCIVSITDVDFIYQNEFLGCTDRLVITPLTDRCYITLSQALGMSMGGAPAGPAGTGKTETTKDMGKALGKYVVVFNCSDQMDYRGLGRIYKGLAQSGSWGCFDEFNRIELPVLSVAAQQIYIVLTAKKERKSQFIFTDGDVVDLDPEFGIFLTMNPGYAGRQELPENLKIQFRTVAMMVPDRQIIMRVKLASCGFQQNVNLARKFYTLYKLCEEQLTKQVHYDFGLRNILSVLRTLGASKRANPEDGEDKIVMRVLRDMNLSKLVDEDEPLFLSLIDDLFPGLTLQKAGYPDIEQAIAEAVEEAKLVNHAPWVLKLIQLYETQRVRHGMMTLGPSGAGKTKCINILMKAMTQCGAPHKEFRMNPKAITAPQMFGRLDVSTNDWTDGIFSTLWRKTLRAKKGDHIWIVLDGPVDAIWIENLNSVLDDNKTLTLANGDRIPMAPLCKVVFEPHNIDNASPATVSRNGMVYMSSSILHWQPILQGWLNTRSPVEADVLMPLFEKVFSDLRIYVEQNLVPKMDLLECNHVMQAINLLQGLIPAEDSPKQADAAFLEKLFVFSLMWSIGASLELADRKKMEEWLLENAKDLKLPPVRDEETIFEYLVNEQGEWEHWFNRVEEYQYSKDVVPEYASILVPNVDNVRTDFLIHTIAKQGKAVLLIGEQGTAKTVMIQGSCNKYDAEVHLAKSMNFSSATSPNMFQRTIESYVDKRMGTTYGPPAGKKMTVFIDDINMPIINEWGDQITNEIVRQLMEMSGFYNLDKPGDFTNIVDIQYIAAMIQPGGGRNDIPSRLKRQFTVFNCTLPSDASIDKIFTTIGEGYFCEERGFSTEIRSMVTRLVSLTRKLWQRTKIKMLPTPAKFHYIFNLRDLSRIWQGILNMTSEVLVETSILLNLWKHECKRVIADRFTNKTDKDWFEKAVRTLIEEDIGAEMVEVIQEDQYFVDFMRDAPEITGDEPEDADIEAPKVYESIGTFENLNERLKMFMASYNEAIRGGRLDLVFFRDAMVHLVKISRIIRTPRGNALLVGVGGSGKQSLTRLASFIAGYKTFQITLSRSYNTSNLMDDLKILYRTAGQQGCGITFIFTDNEIKDEGFLEYMNNVIASGEVSNLFARDEIDEITQDLIGAMKKEFPRRPPTNENLYDYFISRVRNNLHVVLCFSPVGEKFRNRSLKFPGLFSGCTMDWFSSWPADALIAVAHHFLASFEIACSAEIKQAVVNTMGLFQDKVADTCVEYFERFRRQMHVTPKSYLSFIAGYKEIYKEKHTAIGVLADRMNTGLNKLVEATESVAKLSQELVVKEKELAVASVKADKVLQEVTVSAQAAEKVKSQVQKVKDKAQAIVDEIAVDKGFAEEKLEAAKPALAEAEAALQTIKPAHIATVRKLAKPPHLIMRIMDCVLLLFGKRVDPVTADPERPCVKPSWSESLKLMSQGGFLQTLLTFPKDMINEETVELLAPYLEMEDYTLESAKKVCGDVAGLASWTKAMAFFYGVNKEVLPLKANLAIQEVRLNKATSELNEAQEQLDEKQRELDAVQAKFDEAMREKQMLIDDAEACRRKMANATALIEGLGGEKVRWTEQSRKFAEQIRRLVGDVLLATGFLSYSGPFNQEFRNLLLSNWKQMMQKNKIPFSEDLNLTEMLTDSATIGEWNLQGLPNDELSIQNGIIVTKATRFPLLIDPQGQGKAWIKNKESAGDLQVTSLNNKYFRNHLDDALSLGRPLLLEDVGEELDPVLDNILEKNFIKSGSTLKVKVGDKEVDVMEGFVLYITTKLGNPAYTPEISAKTSIIDFTVTMKGLEDQLLGRVILTEKQELEAERTKLMEEVTSNKRKMKDLEDNLLYRLTSTQGSLVDDDSLISVLGVTKTTSEEVSEKLIVAAETEVKINTAREEYRPVASRGSILYFLIVEMSYVNIMYQTSLKQFLGLFDISMARSQKSPIPAKRIQNIIDYLTFEVFRYTTRGLYESHKFLFTLLLALKIELQDRKIKQDEFQVLIKGGAALDLNAVEPKPKKWISDMTWLNLVQLSKLQQFSQILGQITRNDKSWKTWFDSDTPEDSPIPDGYEESLDTFRKLLLIRSWCPDRTVSQARRYIGDSIGTRFAEGVILNLEAMWEESDPRTPMVCLLSMGSDPTASIELLSKKNRLECRAISMGQGQEVHARRLLQQFMAEGGWVLLQNCHLGLNFLDELLDTVLTTETVNANFRLWITTEEHPKFPINFLQSSIKFTNEPPEGIKAGLKRTYAGVTQDQLDVTNMVQWKPMLYAAAFLHTVVQERRKFGPLGWNIPYEFNSADLGATVQFIQNHLDDLDAKKGVSWLTVHYMIGEVQYGGRVTDDFDKRLLNTYAHVWFTDALFQDSFKFYNGYTIPRCTQIADFRSAIEELPLTDTPEVFGLHPNADITYQAKTTTDVLETIVNIQPKDSGGGGGETRETVVFRQASEMLDKLPDNYVPHEVKARLQKMGALTSMNIFLRQEVDRMQRVITTVRTTLVDLKLAIDGTIIMSENLKDALDNIYDARVPALWKKISWESTTLGFWFTDLIERNNQFSTWLFDGRPICFWMTGFFNPQGFLTAMRQEITRAHKGWALDCVVLSNDVTKYMKEDLTSAPAEGVYVYGLFLDGAGWDRRNCRLVEPPPKVLFSNLPVVHIYAVNTTSAKDPRLYECPVYKKPRRTDLTYIFCLNLKTMQHPDHWILRGVALLCDTK